MTRPSKGFSFACINLYTAEAHQPFTLSHPACRSLPTSHSQCVTFLHFRPAMAHLAFARPSLSPSSCRYPTCRPRTSLLAPRTSPLPHPTCMSPQLAHSLLPPTSQAYDIPFCVPSHPRALPGCQACMACPLFPLLFCLETLSPYAHVTFMS